MLTYDSLLHYFQNDFDQEKIKIILGMAFGLRSKASDIDTAMRESGLTHLMVFSGSNVALLVNTLQYVLRPVTRTRTRHILMFTFVCILPYIYSPDPSLIRAVIMTAAPLIARYAGYEVLTWHVFILSALAMLIYDPYLAGNISYQLSFGSVAGILMFGPKHDDTTSSMLRSYIRDSLLITLSAQTLTTPLIWYYFDELSLTAPLANTLVSVVPSIVTVTGYLYIISKELGLTIVTPILLHILNTACEYLSYIAHQTATLNHTLWKLIIGSN